MPELSAKQIGELQDLLQRLCPSLGTAFSEQLHCEVALDLLDVRGVSLTDLLSRTESVVQTSFVFGRPEGAEGVFLAPDDTARTLVDLMEGMSGGDPTNPLTDEELDTLSAGMTAFVRGFALGLHELSGDLFEIDLSATHIGALTVPPVFALDGSAVEAQFAVLMPENMPILLNGLFTTTMMTDLIAAGSRQDLPSGGPALSEDDVAAMFSQVAGEDFGLPGGPMPVLGANADLPSTFSEMSVRGQNLMQPRGLEMILDIPLDVTVELGRVRMLIRDVLELSTGSVIELDRIAGEPVDLLVNGRLVAKGEVVVIEDNFGIRITEIVSPAERVVGIGRGGR